MIEKWKVGDKAATSCGAVEIIAGPDDYGFYCVKREDHLSDFLLTLVNKEELKPTKTPAEVERDRVLKLAENACRNANKGVHGSTLKWCADTLYNAGMLVDPKEKQVKPLIVDKWLIDNGYSTGGSVSSVIVELIEGGFIISADKEQRFQK